MLHQVELGSSDPVQLNGRGYTVDDVELGSNSDLTRVQSWTTLVQRALSRLYAG